MEWMDGMNGMEWNENGMEWNGMEWMDGMEWNGMDGWNGMDDGMNE